jgi:hypothetical protein
VGMVFGCVAMSTYQLHLREHLSSSVHTRCGEDDVL